MLRHRHGSLSGSVLGGVVRGRSLSIGGRGTGTAHLQIGVTAVPRRLLAPTVSVPGDKFIFIMRQSKWKYIVTFCL